MGTRPETQLLRYLKAYNKNISQNLTDFDDRVPTIQLNKYLNSPWVKINVDFTEGSEILIAQDPDPDLAELSSSQHAAALDLFYTLKEFDVLHKQEANSRILVGIGVFQDVNAPNPRKIPILQQVLFLKSTNEGKTIRVICNGPLTLNPELLSSIPMASPALVQECLDLYSSHSSDLTSQKSIVEFLSALHNLITIGGSDTIRISFEPFLFLSTDFTLYSELVDQLLNGESMQPHLAQCIFDVDQPMVENDHADQGPISEITISKLDQDQLVLIQDMIGTDSTPIVTDVVRHYLHSDKNVLIVSPFDHLLEAVSSEFPSGIKSLNSSPKDTEDKHPTDSEELLAAQIAYGETYQSALDALGKVKQRLKLRKIQVATPKSQSVAPVVPSQGDTSSMRMLSINTAKRNFWKRTTTPTRAELVELLRDFKALTTSDIIRDKWCWKIIEATRYIRKRKELVELIDNLKLHCDGLTRREIIAVKKNVSKELLLAELPQIIAHFDDQGTLSPEELARNSNWNTIVDAYSVKGKKPVSKADFQDIEIFIRSQDAYKELAQKWDQVLPPSQHDILSMNCAQLQQLLGQLQKSLAWNATVFEPLIHRMQAAGFDWTAFFTTFNQAYVEKGFINVLNDDVLPNLYIHLQNRINELSLNEDISDLVDTNTLLQNNTLLNLNPYLQDLQQAKANVTHKTDQAIITSSRGSLTILSWADFLNAQQKLSTPAHYDLVIILAAEQIDAFGLLLFYYTNQMLLIGDPAQRPLVAKPTPSPALAEIKASLLDQFSDYDFPNEQHSLWEMLQNLRFKPLKLNMNVDHLPALTNLLSKEGYDNQLVSFLPLDALKTGILPNALDKIIAEDQHDTESILHYIHNLLQALDRSSASQNLNVAVLEFDEQLHDEIFTPRHIEQLSKGVKQLNVTASRLSDLTRHFYDVVILLDMKITKSSDYTEGYQKRINRVVSLAQKRLIYLYLANRPNSKLGKVLTAPQHSLAFKPTPSSSLIEDILRHIRIRRHDFLQMDTIAKEPVDLFIPSASTVVLTADTLKSINTRHDFLNWVQHLYDQGLNILVIKDPYSPQHIAAELQVLLTGDLNTPLSDPLADLQDVIKETNSRWLSSKVIPKPLKPVSLNMTEALIDEPIDLITPDLLTLEASEEEPIDSLWGDLTMDNKPLDLLQPTVVETELTISKPTPKPPVVEKQHIEPLEQPTLEHNSVAMFNFSGEDQLVNEIPLPIIPEPEMEPQRAHLQDLTIMNNQPPEHELAMESEAPLVQENDLFSLTPTVAEKTPEENPAKPFDIIAWLEANQFDYHDLRPNGRLWVIDHINVRRELRRLRSRGYSFTLHIESPEAPNKATAWCLEE